MRNNRLFEIIYILLARKRVTAKELADHFEVSTRTIYRDIDALSAAGVPVYAAQGAGGGISLDEAFVISKSTLSDAEQAEILFALKSLTVADDTSAGKLLTRLCGLFGKQSDQWIEVDFSHWGQRQRERDILAMLKRAILQKQVIAFRYYASNGSQTDRIAYPVKLIYKTHSWYLQAFDPGKGAFRTFKLFRMEDLRTTEAYFSEEALPPTPPLSDFWGKPTACFSAKLWFHARVVFRVFDSFNVQEFLHAPDGSMTATLLLPDDSQSIDLLLSFGVDARVIAPAVLIQKLSDKIKNIQDLYL